MTALSIFRYDGADVRTVTIDGEPWFVLADVVAALGLARSASAVVDRLDPEVRQTYPIRDALGREQRAIVINEPGVYEVVIRSNAPAAREFRRWLTHVVIPSIRHTGGYQVADVVPALPQNYAEALRELLSAVERNDVLEAQAAVDAPKVEYVETFVADDDVRVLRHVANNLDIGESELRHALILHKWIYEEKTTRWSASQGRVVDVRRYSAYADKRDYFQHVPSHEAPRFRGEVMHTLKVTPQGAVAIARAARQWGLIEALAVSS